MAALIAGAISFAVTVLAKDQKTSEFRQAWIDGLRNDVSELAGGAISLFSAKDLKANRNEDSDAYLLERHAEISKLDTLIFRIRMRLNPSEHSEIIALLEFFHSDGAASKDEVNSTVSSLVEKTQALLKSEWTRVKKGEFSFRVLKFVSLAVAALSLIAVAVTFITRA
jgi:hypothetical protein